MSDVSFQLDLRAVEARLKSANKPHQHAGRRYLTCPTCDAELDIGEHAKADLSALLAALRETRAALAGMFPITKHDWDVGEARCPHCAAAKAAFAKVVDSDV